MRSFSEVLRLRLLSIGGVICCLSLSRVLSNHGVNPVCGRVSGVQNAARLWLHTGHGDVNGSVDVVPVELRPQ